MYSLTILSILIAPKYDQHFNLRYLQLGLLSFFLHQQRTYAQSKEKPINTSKVWIDMAEES